MLILKHITKDYKLGDMTVNALRGVDLSFRKSEFVAILGPSGCGKTTLLNIIGGLDRYLRAINRSTQIHVGFQRRRLGQLPHTFCRFVFQTLFLSRPRRFFPTSSLRDSFGSARRKGEEEQKRCWKRSV
jgi:ABC-type lipoprotein export system ATPase subunit